MEQIKKKKRLTFRNWLCIALACMLISMIGSFLVQTSGTSIKVRRFKLVVSGGYEINGQMYIPKDASTKNKLPMVVVQHGSQHNLEMQDMNMVELSRRGYIVISTDAYGHGSSTARDVVPPTEAFNNVISVIDYVCNSLNIVDTDKIGIAGHSMGAAIVTSTLQHYVEQEARGLGKNKIAACLEIGYDPSYIPYTFKGVDKPVLADANWGVIAGKYDEFFFKQKDVNNDPAKILQSKAALDFVKQVDSSAQGPVENGKIYKGQINGKECSRVFYQISADHPQEIFSSQSAADAVSFFYDSLGVPAGHEKIDPNNQVWQWKQFFNFLGLVGVLLFLFPFAKWIMNTVPYFSELKAKNAAPAAPALDTTKKKLVYWISWVVCMAIPGILAMPVMHYWIGKQSFTPVTVTKWFGEGSVNEIAGWAVISSLCILAIFLFNYFIFGKKFGAKTDSWGIKISPKALWKSLLLAVMTFGVAYLILFTADFFFTTDFRIWLIAMRVFSKDKVLFLIAYFPAFAIFYLINSMLVDGGNRVEGMPEWLITLISCIANIGGIAVVIFIQYFTYARTGIFPYNAMRTINLFPFLVQVPVATIITRKYFKETGNIYLGSFTISLLYSMMIITQVSINTSIIS